MIYLKPCPFCGSEWVQVRWIGFKDAAPSGMGPPGYRGECTDCGATTRSFLDEDTAAIAWNIRMGTEQITHCAECIHSNEIRAAEYEPKLWCSIGMMGPVCSEDFCSRAKRKKEAEHD